MYKKGNNIKVCIVGLGFGANFIPIYMDHPNCELIAICDINEEILNIWGDKFNVPYKFNRFEDILKIKEINAIHINTPIPDHSEKTIAALSAGKHVACTVPMATRVEDCIKIIEAKKKNKRVYMMMETSIFTREFFYVKKLVDSGKIGKIQFLRGTHIQNMDGWPKYWFGLPPMFYGTHAISPLAAIMGKKVESVICFGSGSIRKRYIKYHNSPYAFETTYLFFKNSNVIAEVSRSLYDVTRQYIESFSVYGSKLSFEWNLLNKEKPILFTGNEDAKRIDLPDTISVLPREISRYKNEGIYNKDNPHRCFNQGKGYHGGSHPHLVHEFIKSIVECRDSIIDVEKAANWTCAGICAHESAMKGGKRIYLPKF